MNTWKRTCTLFAAVAVAGLVLAPVSAEAKRKRGVKRLAMKRFDVGSREVSVIATAKDGNRGAALVRLKHMDVPVCQLLILDAPARSAHNIVNAVRLPVCAAYDKEAHSVGLKRIQITTDRGGYQVNVLSKRMDAIAKGVEIRRLWGIYADFGSGMTAVFERTSTSFESRVNDAINQSEVCEAPTFTVDDRPGNLSISCVTKTTLDGHVHKQRSTFNYRWDMRRFARQ